MTEETAEEQKARDEAQARRQRILDGAGTRMDVVEGVVPSADGTKADTASKLAAMRRRRFKKNTTAAATESVVEAEEKVETKEAAAAAAAAPEPTTVVPASLSTKIADDAGVAEATTQEEEEGGETKKKYMGVAKMRRMKLKEKQQQQEQQQDQQDADASTENAGTLLAKKKAAKKHKSAARLPILMHIVTVLLLFVAGLDIGLQQVAIDYQQYDDGASRSVLDVHTGLAPGTLGGVSFFMSKLYGNATFVRGGDMKVRLMEETIASQSIPTHVVETDEFADAIDDKESMKTVGVIDPIFGVDLDDLAAGPGPVQWAARQAVKFHRLLLRIFYYGPSRIFYWLLACATSPPIFCLVAVLLRQLVGKAILGAALPDAKEDEDQAKDVMSMIQRVVTNFIFSAFPTAVSLYDAWCHLRADMYVVLCGFFCGLALSHTPSIVRSPVFAGLFNQTSPSDEPSDEL